MSSARTAIQYTLFPHNNDERCGGALDGWTPEGLTIYPVGYGTARRVRPIQGPLEINIPVLRPVGRHVTQLSRMNGRFLTSGARRGNGCLAIQFDPHDRIDRGPGRSLSRATIHEIDLDNSRDHRR